MSIDGIVTAAVLTGTLGVVGARAAIAWLDFRMQRRTLELLRRGTEALEDQSLPAARPASGARRR